MRPSSCSVGPLSAWRTRWLKQGFETVRQAWLARTFGLGENVTLRLPEGPVCGRFADLSGSGALLLEDGEGRRRAISAGDLFFAGT